MAFLDLTFDTFKPEEGYYDSELESLGSMPIRTFAPVGYEPRYAYPLLVFLHGQGGNEEEILRLAPGVSRRNYVAISLRGPVAIGLNREGSLGYSWGDGAQLAMIEDYLFGAIEQTQQYYHIHPDRIVLAGFAEGATLAYRMGMLYPGKINGVVALNGHMPRVDRPLLRLPELRSLGVFIGHGIANSVVPAGLVREDCKLLWSAGMEVKVHRYPTNHRLHPDMLRDLNRWVIARCS